MRAVGTVLDTCKLDIEQATPWWCSIECEKAEERHSLDVGTISSEVYFVCFNEICQ